MGYMDIWIHRYMGYMGYMGVEKYIGDFYKPRAWCSLPLGAENLNPAASEPGSPG